MNARYSRRQVLAGGTAAAASGLLLNKKARAQAGPIRIGMLQSISGPFSSLGNGHVIGARIAVKMINDSGGVNGRPVELVVRDTRGNAGEMVAGLRELAGSGINLIIGEAVSGLNIAAQPVAPSLDVVYVLSTSIAMELTHELANRNCFRAHQNAFMQFGGEAKLIADRYPNLKRWGCYAADAAGLRVSQEYLYYGLKKSYGAQGKQIELLEPVLAKIGAADFRNQITKLVGQNLEGIVLADSGANLLSFIKQAVPFGLFNSVGAVAELTFYPPMHAALKKETPQNWWTNCSWIYELHKSQPMAETFYKLAFEETKVPLLDPYIAQAHLAITAMVSGVRAAKSTKTEDVINALETITFDSIYGPVSFRKEDHQLQVNGTFIRLGPDDSEAGWSIKETVQIPWKDTIEPPTPGKKFEVT